MQTPTVNITNDEAQAACRNKGDGWHLLTMMEHGFLANLSLKRGTLPHGNTNYGKYHADENEHGIPCPGSSGRVLTGSGPDTWLHDHTAFGVDGLCGDIWEHVAGFRLMNGILRGVKALFRFPHIIVRLPHSQIDIFLVLQIVQLGNIPVCFR